MIIIVDYGSGNLRSAAKAFERMVRESGMNATVAVTSRAEDIARADRIVLPGVGAFTDCRDGVTAVDGLMEALQMAVRQRAVPFLGICVGMQLMASRGLEYGVTEGFDWIAGDVTALQPADRSLKIPHMGWNDLIIQRDHAVLKGIATGDHAYFVHSYHFLTARPEHILATVDYGAAVTAIVGQDNMIGTQFHPEKSQQAGLRLISNFLRWKP